jgi:hypothetical protein
VQFEFLRHPVPIGVILSEAVLQAQRRISRALPDAPAQDPSPG